MNDWFILFFLGMGLLADAIVSFLVGYFLGWRLRGEFEKGNVGPQELRGKF